jgi:DNA-binding XRE family transcriptional regulator
MGGSGEGGNTDTDNVHADAYCVNTLAYRILVAYTTPMSEAEYVAWLDGVRERLRATRKALGLTYRAAGDRTGVPFQTITRVETGKVRPTSEVLFTLAKGYGVSLEELLCGCKCPPRKPRRKP